MFCATEAVEDNEANNEMKHDSESEADAVQPSSTIPDPNGLGIDPATGQNAAPKKKKIVWTPETLDASRKSICEKVIAKIEIVKEATETKNYSEPKYAKAYYYLGSCYFGLKNAPLAERMKLRLEVVDIFFEHNLIPMIIEVLSALVDKGLPTEFLNETGELIENIIKPARNTLGIMFNFSDASAKFCSELMKTNELLETIFKCLTKLKSSHFKKTLNFEVDKMLRICVSLIYNIVMHEELDFVDDMHEVGLVTAVQPYLESPSNIMRAAALLYIVYVVNEDEASKMCTNQSSIKLLISRLEVALKDKYKRGSGYSNTELLKAIGKLSALDLKKTLADVGALQIMKGILETGDDDEIPLAVNILWQMAFDHDNARWIKDSNIQEMVNQHARKFQTKEFRRAAQGLLWVVEEKTGKGIRGTLFNLTISLMKYLYTATVYCRFDVIHRRNLCNRPKSSE